MKTRILTALAVSSLSLTMLGTPARAQEAAKATIPFEFSVGGKLLPAGQYDVRPQGAFSMRVQDSTGANCAMAVAMTADAGKEQKAGEATLVFHRYGEQYFLSEVWTQDRSRKLPESKLEREVARHAAELASNRHESEVVYLAALIR